MRRAPILSEPVPDSPLSIVQVAPRRGPRSGLPEYVSRLSVELEQRGHKITRLTTGDKVKRLLARQKHDIVHVHEPFAKRVS